MFRRSFRNQHRAASLPLGALLALLVLPVVLSRPLSGQTPPPASPVNYFCPCGMTVGTGSVTAGDPVELMQELLDWGPAPLIAALVGWQPTGAAVQELKQLQFAYFVRRQERMRYPAYLRRGFPIGSGVAEGACKPVVIDRLAASGMRWKPATAEPVLALRAALLAQPRLDLRRVLEQPIALPACFTVPGNHTRTDLSSTKVWVRLYREHWIVRQDRLPVRRSLHAPQELA